MDDNDELKRGTRPQMAPKEKESGLAGLFGGGASRKAPYTSVFKSLEAIGLEPKMMTITLGDEPTQCLVIPTQELVYKEWQHMTDSKFAVGTLGEGSDDE